MIHEIPCPTKPFAISLDEAMDKDYTDPNVCDMCGHFHTHIVVRDHPYKPELGDTKVCDNCYQAITSRGVSF